MPSDRTLPQMPITGDQERFDRMLSLVLERRPVLSEILSAHGDETLYEYSRENLDSPPDPVINGRQDEFLAVFRDEVERLLGRECAEGAVRQLARYYFVSTADHHGPLCHPFWLNSDLVTAMPYEEKGDPALNYVIVLATSNVYLNNCTYPRGLLYQSAANGKTFMHRYPFFSRQSRQSPVFGFQPYTKQEVDAVTHLVQKDFQNGEISQSVANSMRELIRDVYDREEVYALGDYSDQVTVTNSTLWRKFFDSSSDRPRTELVYLEQKRLVNQLILRHHLDQRTSVNRMLFADDMETEIEAHYEGMTGAFSIEDNTGTYLFWALPPGATLRQSLRREGNKLVSEHGDYTLELDPTSVRQAIEKGELIPSMLLSYTVLALYYGLRCLGGYSQVNYLTSMKEAYIKLHEERGNTESVAIAKTVETKKMGADMMVAFASGPDDTVVSATGIDLALYGRSDTWATMMQQARTITLREAISSLMPELYPCTYTERERDPELLTLATSDVSRLIGLDKKIKTCVSL